MKQNLVNFYQRVSENYRPRTFDEHIEWLCDEAKTEAERRYPSFPPRLSLLAYPKRCLCGLFAHDRSTDGLTRVECADGHSWIEVSL
jgi:hypothetical protein